MACINVRGGHKCVDYHCPGNAKYDGIYLYIIYSYLD